MQQILVDMLIALHMVCVCVAGGAPLAALWLEWSEARGSRIAGVAGRRLVVMATLLLLAGGLLGLLAGMLAWSDEYAAALGRLRGRVFAGIGEYLFSVILMAAHYVWWAKSPAAGWSRWVRCLLPFLAATNLLYHFPFFFLVFAKVLRLGPGEKIASAEFMGMAFSLEILPRALHIWIASVAAAGAALIADAPNWPDDKSPQEHEPTAGELTDSRPADARDAIARGASRMALLAVLLQLPIGLWVLIQLPATVQSNLAGNNWLATALFALSVLGSLSLMHLLSKGMLRPGEAISKRKAIVLVMSAVIVLMCLAARRAAPAVSPAAPADSAVDVGRGVEAESASPDRRASAE